MINSVTILGGGTAGLISALMLRATYSNLKITVVESSQYGIIGVGEGSTEHWRGFMNHCSIDVFDLVKETGATFKTGIRFENWNGDGKEYWHSLPEYVAYRDGRTGICSTMVKMIADDSDPMLSVYSASIKSEHSEPYHDIVNQYHFDTNKLNTFFHKLCNERNIDVVDDIVEDVIIENGIVKSLIGQKKSYAADFFIDSSGFRKIINSKLDVKWVDCSNQLPMNSAIAAPSPREEEIPSHTLARALSSGWMWRIPTQDRFGNGYVYCDKFISDEDAEKEFRSQFPYDITIAKKIKFSAGYVDKFWASNCLSVGLAGMFVEPLEATSIGSTIQQMFGFCSDIFYWTKENQNVSKTYNKTFRKVAENIIDFVQLHYMTSRDDSEFWKWAKDNIELTEFHKEHLETFKTQLPGLGHFNSYFTMFKELNYLQVMHGLGLFDNQAIHSKINTHIPWVNKQAQDNFISVHQHIKESTYVSHRTALNEILKRHTAVHYKI